ncbi:hypothetical protein SZ64_10440 [Erythrobacter sp. SG61-1L]|nr:hypothetical protein SZ64_10440 [Erythrobacter sp. SG61-1L]
MVGADGYQSVVRRQMCPERPDAAFAHYLAWVGFAEESALSVRFPPHLEFLEAGPYLLLGFPLTAAEDAMALARFLDGAALRTDPVAALRSYEASRLPDVRRLGLSGQRISLDFAQAARRP